MDKTAEPRVYELIATAILTALGIVAVGIHREPSWIDPPQMIALVERGARFVDVRPAFLTTRQTLPNALLVPKSELERRLGELPRNRPLIVYGAVGGDSAPCYRLLRAHGFEAYDIGHMNRFPRGLLEAGHDHGHEPALGAPRAESPGQRSR